VTTYTTQARIVLDDCRHAWERLELVTDDVEFRLFWVAGVALVRAVGHVLHKIDGGDQPILRKIAERHHRTWKAGDARHRIFSDFIDRERNNILKEYAFEISEGDIPIAVFGADDGVFSLDENLFRPMDSGPYAGEDGRDVLKDAIDWWSKRLDEIDREVSIQISTARV
jgi:hypothetical protein